MVCGLRLPIKEILMRIVDDEGVNLSAYPLVVGRSESERVVGYW